MDDITSGKKSQKRKDRQERKAERRKAKAEALVGKPREKKKPVKARLSKKSLPGFLAKNVKTIIQWLKDYETLFVLADDYGIQRLDRLSEERRNILTQNYIDVSEFITVLQEIIEENENPTNQISADCIDEYNVDSQISGC